MIAYVGQTRTNTPQLEGKPPKTPPQLLRRLLAKGIGECCNRGEYPPYRTPWFMDNGAFVDWKAGVLWDEKAWRADVEQAAGHATPPDFIVCPDLVAEGSASLAHSLRFRSACEGFTTYLAVQDGMQDAEVAAALREFDGLFVGGTLPWKMATGSRWVELAQARGKPCHIGRVGVASRVRWAKEIRADSIDSCFPLWCEENLQKFLRALEDDRQQILWT